MVTLARLISPEELPFAAEFSLAGRGLFWLLLAGVSLFAAPVMAATYAAGTLGATPYTKTVQFLAPAVSPYSFIDIFTFNTGSLTQITASMNSATVLFGDGTCCSLGIANGSNPAIQPQPLTMSLFPASVPVSQSTQNPLISVTGYPGSFTQLLAPETSYQLRVMGAVTGAAGGLYTLDLSAVAQSSAPIPEPASWVLLLAGLAALPASSRYLRRTS